MAVAFEIKGKTTVKNSANTLGQTDADDMIVVEEIIHERMIHTSGSGPELPAEIINLGRSAILRIPLIEFDLAIIEPLIKAQGATNDGEVGDLGAAIGLISIQILGEISGSKHYTFPKCRFIDAIRFEQWGQIESKLGLVIAAVPDPTALQTATTPLYTVGTVA